MCRGQAQYPSFAPDPCFCSGSSEVAVGFFGLFVSFVHNLPQLCVPAVGFSLGEVCSGASIATKGPRSQSVSLR